MFLQVGTTIRELTTRLGLPRKNTGLEQTGVLILGKKVGSMDREARQLFRKLVQRGDLVNFLLATMAELNEEDAFHVFTVARFHVERTRTLYGTWNQKVAVCWLSDDAILDKINSPPGRSVRRQYAAGARRDSERKIIDLIWEEAEYRGLLSEDQKRWIELGNMTPAQRSAAIGESLASGECLVGGHKFVLVGGEHVCTECRRRITDEEVMVRVRRECAGRLRLPGC